MNVWKKFGALMFVLVLAMGLSVSALAVDDPVTLTSGVAGAYSSPDTPTIEDNRSVNIVKELIANNANSTTVYAPVFTYVYTVTPASVSSYTVTDAPDKHNPEVAVTMPVTAGITAGLKVNEGDAGTDEKATGEISFTNATSLSTTADTNTSGVNSYNITLNFSNVAFTQAGVYRYKISETLKDSITFAQLGMTGGTAKDRYLDVYVDGSGKIYGYVCIANNSSVTTTTEKTNGFVNASNGADTYYTYDVTLSKVVENDTYAKTSHPFPFTVIFSAGSLNGTFQITETIADNTNTGVTARSTGITTNAGNATWSGVAKVYDGSPITYTGIPAGASLAVYETNDFAGASYTAATSITGGASDSATDNSVNWGSEPNSATAQSASKPTYESTSKTVATTIGTAVTAKVVWTITNTLLQISPTGVTLRYAPYLLTLGAGIVALPLTKSYRKREDF